MRIVYLLILVFTSITYSFAFHKDQIHNENLPESAADNNQTVNNTSDTEISRGEMLYKNHCQVCHESNVHVRENRRAKSVNDIVTWVTRWSSHLELGWERADIEEVARHLEETYYKFSDKTKQ